ncbi:MAG: dTMP kinase [Chloroflexi bacterium]|nr:dTMP kinase [Chloroflexota bacterium]
MFITFEGPEGSGKSTQAQLLFQFLQGKGHDVILTREPGGTRLGENLRQVVMFGENIAVSPRAETLIFAAARAQLVEDVIRAHLVRGHVVCDRFADSTTAYQGYGRGLPIRDVLATNAFATGGLVPDLTILLDIPVEIGLLRNCNDISAGRDRFESEDIAFHGRVRQGYLALAAAEPSRWRVIDATLTREEAHHIICREVEAALF